MKLLIITFFLIIINSAYANTDYEFIDTYVKNNKQFIKLQSGTAVAVVKNNKVVYEGYFGYSDIKNEVKVNKDTVFYIASMTKPVFGLLTLLLEEQGKLKTSDTLQSLLSEIKFKPAIRANEVQIKDLISHTSGIDNWPLIQATAYTGNYDKNLIANIIESSYVNEKAPLGQYRYTNVGYNILSHWMDNTFESNWQALLKKEIFSPLNMKHTSAMMSDIESNNWQFAQGYSVKSMDPMEPVYLRKIDKTMHAAGGLVSTASDLANFLMAQINLGRVNNDQVLPKSVIAKSHEVLTTFGSGERQRHYGWGWFVRSIFGETLYEHRGGYPGVSTYMSFSPKTKTGLIVLSNQDKWGGDLAFALEDFVYGVAVGKSSKEINELIVEHENFVKKKANKFYTSKKTSQNTVFKDVPQAYDGRYSHALLGSINVKTDVQGNTVLSWGNLKSKVYKNPESDSLIVEFSPNRYEPISFLVGLDNSKVITYKDYQFIKN